MLGHMGLFGLKGNGQLSRIGAKYKQN
jgi:hypothetical protein